MILRYICRFLEDRRGNILPMFGLSIIPLMGLIGAAVDYSRANAVKSKIQAALDSTALAMAASAATLSPNDLTTNANNYFQAMFDAKSTTGVTITAVYSNTAGEGPRVTVSGTTDVKTQFMNIPGIGIDQMPVSASSTTAWGNNRLRVALALDNTTSMNQSNKMNALKTAAKNLIDQLSSAAKDPADVYVSIIPFAVDVKVGKDSVSATWLGWDKWDETHGGCNPKKDSKGKTITQKSVCEGRGVGGKWTPDHSSWSGCVMDRDNTPVAYNTTNNAPSISNAATLFPADDANCGNGLVGIMPLSNNWSALKNTIGAMTPDGSTNTTIGLEWAWHSLTQGAPLNAPAEDPNYQYNKVIIFLTDGENTQDRWDKDSRKIDPRMSAACTNAKAAGISVYTILVLDGTASLLQGCASTPSQYFKITSSTQLVDVFSQIGSSLSRLRVAK